jgi:hypothetical protein
MDHHHSRIAIALTTLLVVIALMSFAWASAQTNSAVPRMWDDAALERLEVPLSHAPFSPKHVSADYYYQIPVRPIFRAYPVYAPMGNQQDTSNRYCKGNPKRSTSTLVRSGMIATGSSSARLYFKRRRLTTAAS